MVLSPPNIARHVLSGAIFLCAFNIMAIEKIATFKNELTLSESNRAEFTKAGETYLINVGQLCKKIQCKVEITHKRYWKIENNGKGVIWDAQYPQVAKSLSNHHAYEIQLPVPAIKSNDKLQFPIRILVEILGYNSLYNKNKKSISVYKLKPLEKSISVKLKNKISGSSTPVSYFMDAIEYDNFIYLVFDYSYKLYRFDKKNNLKFKTFEIDKKYGILRKFEDFGDGKIVVLTEKGYIFHLKNEKLIKIGGGGNKILTKIGESDLIQNLKFKSLAFISKANAGTGYILDDSDQKIYKIDSKLKRATYIFNTKKWNWILDLVTFKGDPIIFYFEEKDTSIVRLQSSKKFAPINSPCAHKLFKGKRIYGGRPQNNKQWIFLDSASRNIVHANFTFSDVHENNCKILKEHFTGNNTAFLNNFGQSFTKQKQNLIIDSDGFNIVKYSSLNKVTFYSKEILFKNIKPKWVAPISLAEINSDLYVLGNLSHQVYKLNSKNNFSDGEIFLGNGQPQRKNEPKINRKQTSIGYPSYITSHKGNLWVADHFGRRVLEVQKDNVLQTFPPPSHTFISGISGFAFAQGKLYLTDPILGLVFSYSQPHKKSDYKIGFFKSIYYRIINKLKKNKARASKNSGFIEIAGQFSPQALQDSEVFRRAEATTSIDKMNNFSKVRFGFPQSIIRSSDDKLLISDIYRHGIWELDPKTEKVRPLAGFKTTANYHFGSVNGNIGFPGAFTRLNSPGILEYSEKHKVYLIPSVYGEKIIMANKDFSNTCYIDTDIAFKAPFQALLMSDRTLVIADSVTHDIYFYEIMDDSCLRKTLDSALFEQSL